SDAFNRGELAQPEALERAMASNPEATLRRRDFLGRTAAVAGGAALASYLPAEQLIAEAARRNARRRLPSPKNMPIDTFVVLMMENRSFDHYFGWHPDADAKNEGLTYPDAEGNPVETYRLTPDFQGCGHPDPDHGWTGGRWQWNGGKNNRFVTGNEDLTSSDEFAIGYYLEEDVPFIPHAADAYTLYDRWFCSIMASTYPNRHYQWGAQNGGQKSNVFPFETEETTGFTWETIADRAEKNGVSFAYYASDLPFSALYGQRGIRWTRRIEQFYVDAATGNLPQITFVDPPFRNGGGGDGLSADEHPHGDIRLGQAFMSDVTHAFMESPQYARGAMFINYDEWGGFFDHVSPPFVPDRRRNLKDLYNDWGFTGFRIPGVVVSPFTRGGKVSHLQVTHESILKLISYKFGFGHLNKRHRYASNIGRSFNFKRPDTEPPNLPDPSQIAATPCSLQAQGAERAKPHDLVELETSGLLDRLGYEIPSASLDQIFRYPDTVKQALEEGNRKGAAALGGG
ncbi:MAG: twin-arginine translocation signal domain-containing protein, partial [Actinomycetota bacterium]|nr:twin-arginine translocation signal domain-containing protein [Actinomycetota bacterium]